MKALKKFMFPIMALLATYSLSAARPARAEVMDNFRSQFSFVVFDAFHDEDILVVTDFHGVMKQFINADGSVTTQFQVNAHGTAVGLESGTVYVYNDKANQAKTTLGPDYTESLHQRSLFLSPGAIDNVVIHYDLVFHVEGGVLTIDVLNQQTESRG